MTYQKPDGKEPLGRTRHRWGLLYWIFGNVGVHTGLNWPRIRRSAGLLRTRRLTLRIQQKAADFFSNWVTVTFSRICPADLVRFIITLRYSRASLIRTNWDSGMFGLVNLRINRVLQNTRREGGDRRFPRALEWRSQPGAGNNVNTARS
jgi:hypothetical protein